MDVLTPLRIYIAVPEINGHLAYGVILCWREHETSLSGVPKKQDRTYASLLALRHALSVLKRPLPLLILFDSMLPIYYLKRKATPSEDLKSVFDSVVNLLSRFPSWDLMFVPGAFNNHLIKASNLAYDAIYRNFYVKETKKSTGGSHAENCS